MAKYDLGLEEELVQASGRHWTDSGNGGQQRFRLELELLMPEKNMKYIDEAMAKSTDKTLPVEYIMLTDTSTKWTGKLSLEGIHKRAELDQEEGAIVKLRVRPMMCKRFEARWCGGESRRYCGKASAAFVWFHPVIEWIYANVIF